MRKKGRGQNSAFPGEAWASRGGGRRKETRKEINLGGLKKEEVRGDIKLWFGEKGKTKNKRPGNKGRNSHHRLRGPRKDPEKSRGDSGGRKES